VIPLKRVAPDISYETCAIVDRAMSYDPRNRFRSYDEMIIALEGAIKALESGGGQHAAAAHAHAQAHAIQRMQLRQKKKKVLITTIVSVVMALIAIFLLIQFITADNSDGPSTVVNNTGNGDVDPADNSKAIISQYNTAKDLMRQGKLKDSEEAFIKLFSNSKVEEPTRSWSGLDGVLAALLDGRMNDASRHVKAVSSHIDSHTTNLSTGFSTALSPALKSFHRSDFQDIKKFNINMADDEHLMACMILGLKNWEQGGLDQAIPFFEKIIREVDVNENGPMAWYRKVADHYMTDYKLLKSIEMKSIPSTPNQCKTASNELENIYGQLKTRGRARFNIRSLQNDMAQHEKYLDKLLNQK
jgi:eukaryotic-like serine/threonine-protein kinase